MDKVKSTPNSTILTGISYFHMCGKGLRKMAHTIFWSYNWEFFFEGKMVHTYCFHLIPAHSKWAWKYSWLLPCWYCLNNILIPEKKPASLIDVTGSCLCNCDRTQWWCHGVLTHPRVQQDKNENPKKAVHNFIFTMSTVVYYLHAFTLKLMQM